MTKVLNLALLGRIQLKIDGVPLTELASGKAQALLCYLAVNGRTYSRQALAGLLWGELPEADARRNLRGALMKLRQSVEPYLVITHQSIAFDLTSHYWLDVAEFKQLLKQPPSPEQLQTAVSLYRGDFLEDFHVRQAPLFDDWVARQQLELRELAFKAYTTLAEHHARAGSLEQGIVAIRRLLSLDPLRESGHRQLMRLLALNGQRTQALAQYTTCRQILADELGIEPAPETADLYQQIRAGRISRGAATKVHPTQERAPSHPASQPPRSLAPFIAGPPVPHPRQFFGREREIKRLFNLLQRLPLQNGAIVGQRRSGKTSLLHYLKTVTSTPSHKLRPGQKKQWLPDASTYRWVFVDFQDPRLGETESLLRYILQQLELPAAGVCDIDYFLDVASENITSPTIILFDEIGVALERYPRLDDAFWESLRFLATNQVGGNLAFILAAHKSPSDLAQHGGLGSPFFNIFGYTARLGPLLESEARELIASSPIQFSPPDVDWILAESGRWPMTLQILCRERLLALEEGDVSDAWREEARRQIAPFKEKQRAGE